MRSVMARQRDQAPWLGHARLRLRHLRLAHAIDRFRNLQKAAQSLHLSQPAASRLLAEMEKAMATPLFERRARGLEPNIYGEAFLRRVRVVLGELHEASEEISALRQGQAGRVVFGSVMAAGVSHAARGIGLVASRHPDISLRIEVGTSDQLLSLLVEGTLDFAIARMADSDRRDLIFETLGTEDLCVIARKTHALVGRRRKLRLADLVAQNWVLQFSGTPLRSAFDLAFRAAGLTPPQQVIECASHEVVAALVQETNALSILSRPLAEIHAASGRFALLTLADPIVLEPYGIVRRRGSELSPAAQSVLAAIRETVVS